MNIEVFAFRKFFQNMASSILSHSAAIARTLTVSPKGMGPFHLKSQT